VLKSFSSFLLRDPVRTEWTRAPLSQRKAHVELLLESLEHRDAEIRFTNARRLFYVLQGQQTDQWQNFPLNCVTF